MKKLLLAIVLVCLSHCSLAQPNTPYPNLLTGQTPFNHTVPSGWTQFATENFENGTFSPAYGNGIFNSTQFHNDGNPADTHSIGCTYGNSVSGTFLCGGGTSWNRFLPSGTRQVYLSWYEWVDSTFRMNDEFFETRFHWDTGNGQPSFREMILDYFQDSTGTYNSTDGTQLWNIQGQPYYQNKLPSNTSGDNTNFVIPVGSWVQREIYMKFSTVSPQFTLSSGVVTLNAAAHTYTRTTGSWIADGIVVGSAPHFTGFSSSANNGDGSAGGGGYSNFVTAVTDLVMTVGASPYLTNDTATNPTMQVDNGDGAYAYYQNGSLIAYQNNMVSPGKVDFSTSNTSLSIGETYSKLIWRGHVNGNCEQQPTAPPPYAGACATGIGGTITGGGCGFEQIPLGWNGAGLTQSAAGSGFNTHIDCDATWGGPMPTPPVFNRYLDDIIVLTQANAPPPTPVAAATLTAGTDVCGNPQQTVAFPGYAQFTLDSGTVATCQMAGTSGQGINAYYDLKNDSTKQWNFGAFDTGMFEHQWGIKNQDGTTRYNEVKEGPMAITVAESNNVRVVLTQSGAVRSVGLLTNPADCCITMSKKYVFYRHGTGSGSGASKVFTSTTMTYNNGDGQAPLTTAGTSTGINYYDKIAYGRVSGEVVNQTNFTGPCSGSSGLVPFTATPWNVIYQASGTNANKDYILISPTAANSATSGEFLPANGCVSPGGSPQGPTIGLIHTCNGPSNSGCVSQTDSAAVVKANFLQIEQEQQCNYMSLASIAPYFGGGLRIYCALGSQTFPANTPRTWTSVGFIGDNGITSTGSATPFVTEYKTPPTITFIAGTGGTFDPVEGYWTMASASNGVNFSANGLLHSPAFLVSSFTSAAPTNITVGGTAYAKDVNYVAVKTDSTHLLLQVLADVPSGTSIAIAGAGGSLTISPKTVSLPRLGIQQFTATGMTSATYTVDSNCHGTINSSTGVFTAGTSSETCTITATSGTLSDFATATISAVTVTPATIAMNVGATQQFTSNFPATWSASCGTISSSGLFTAPSTNCTSTITATAVNGGSTGTATATITGQVTNLPLTIAPTSWNYGTVPISTNSDKVFTITNPGTGTNTISANAITAGGTQFSLLSTTCGGTLAGGATCTDTVRFNSAVAGSFSGNLHITDSAGGLLDVPLTATVAAGVTVNVSPLSATLPYSGVQQFTANVTVTWSRSCVGGGGSITAAGFFTAPAATTTCTITATHTSGATGQANVTVNALSVNPISVTLQVAAKQQFTANFAASWAVTSGTCTITAGGLLTAPGTNTSCIVRATAQNGGSTATASVSVVGAPSSSPGAQVNSQGFNGTIR